MEKVTGWTPVSSATFWKKLVVFVQSPVPSFGICPHEQEPP